jgi:hypothetical protein
MVCGRFLEISLIPASVKNHCRITFVDELLVCRVEQFDRKHIYRGIESHRSETHCKYDKTLHDTLFRCDKDFVRLFDVKFGVGNVVHFLETVKIFVGNSIAKLLTRFSLANPYHIITICINICTKTN